VPHSLSPEYQIQLKHNIQFAGIPKEQYTDMGLPINYPIRWHKRVYSSFASYIFQLQLTNHIHRILYEKIINKILIFSLSHVVGKSINNLIEQYQQFPFQKHTFFVNQYIHIQQNLSVRDQMAPMKLSKTSESIFSVKHLFGSKADRTPVNIK
jgi:hypothetical protein